MRHPKARAWEDRLRAIFVLIDHELELAYGSRFTRKAIRPPHRSTAVPEDDGLFDVGAVFGLGIGSRFGPGYLVEVRIATESPVPTAVRTEIEEFVVRRVREELPRMFPGVDLKVDRDGSSYKIHGDLSLGTA
jgi:hypothetical protein